MILQRQGWCIGDYESRVQVSPDFKINGSWPPGIPGEFSFSLNSATDVKTRNWDVLSQPKNTESKKLMLLMGYNDKKW